MYTIGQFSIMTKIPKKTLRYYDEIDLLKPAQIDFENNYRYYDDNSLMTVQQVLIYRSCEMSLERIKEIIYQPHNTKDLKQILMSQNDYLKQKETEIRQSQSVLKNIINSLDETNKESVKDYFREAKNILSIRKVGNHSMIGEIISELFESAVKNNLSVVGSHTIIWHTDKDFAEDSIDMEIYIPVKPNKNCTIQTLKESPRQRYCEIVHHGPMATLSSSYAMLYSFIEESELVISGPFEETFISEKRFIDPRKMKIIISAPVEEPSK
ncbi:MAG: MerR family transcriptional regulator [Spirochaetales bacterium]|nr:MerR family transcriptional regulator [Spirochaetales bacterium]